MYKVFDDFWNDYKSIHKKYRNKLFLKYVSWNNWKTILALLIIDAAGIFVFELSNETLMLKIASAVILACTLHFWIDVIRIIPVESTKEKATKRISELKELLARYEIDYKDADIYKLLFDYVNERTKRYNPLSLLIEAAQSTLNAAVLVVTFFSGSQEGTMTWEECVIWILRIVPTYFVIRLIITVLKDWLAPKIDYERAIGNCFLDDLRDLKLFN